MTQMVRIFADFLLLSAIFLCLYFFIYVNLLNLRYLRAITVILTLSHLPDYRLPRASFGRLL